MSPKENNKIQLAEGRHQRNKNGRAIESEQGHPERQAISDSSVMSRSHGDRMPSDKATARRPAITIRPNVFAGVNLADEARRATRH